MDDILAGVNFTPGQDNFKITSPELEH